MALQGGIDSFPIVDVLRLLGSTNKTGRLELRGDRGTASVWVVGGEVVAAKCPTAAKRSDELEMVDVMFEMMRFVTGDFEFNQDEVCEAPSPGREVESLISESVELMEEWLEIADALPGMDQKLQLSTEIVHEVMMTPEMWRASQMFAGGRSIRDLIHLFGWSELPALRITKSLIEADLVEATAEITVPMMSERSPQRSAETVHNTPEPVTNRFSEPVIPPAAESVPHVTESLSKRFPDPVAPLAPAQPSATDHSMDKHLGEPDRFVHRSVSDPVAIADADGYPDHDDSITGLDLEQPMGNLLRNPVAKFEEDGIPVSSSDDDEKLSDTVGFSAAAARAEYESIPETDAERARVLRFLGSV